MPAQIDVSLFDGRGAPLQRTKTDVLLSVRDAASTTFHRTFVGGPVVRVPVTFHNNGQDNHTVLASLKKHRDAGFMPVKVRDNQTTPVALMLLPRKPEFEFAPFSDVRASHPALAGLLERTFGAANAPAQHERLQSDKRHALACLMNIVEALAAIQLRAQANLRPNLIEYISHLDLSRDWLHPDRFFAWSDVAIAKALEGVPNLFRPAPKALHDGAAASFKEVSFGEANVQVTLHHEHVGGNLIKTEFDIDYFRDQGAHLLLEVFPNMLKRIILGEKSREAVTDPTVTYALRWMAARQPKATAHARAFAPAFTIQPA
jgi:hypothetical protein